VTRTTRWAAWAILLALAAFQAYAHRYAISPDGVSYLDLSDAVVTGQWSRLLNLYWSPLYPLLIGIGRIVSSTSPEHEITVIHAVNVFCFAAMLAGFEYMLASILSIASRVRHSLLGHSWGAAVSYVVFGAFALTMIPLELTTPDLLNAALAFTALGALLRLHNDPTHSTRHAAILGAGLGVAALAKSFMVPWALMCFVTAAVVLRRDRLRVLVPALGVWLVFVAPWSAALSAKAGRPTFGDAGRLTYAWFVNNEDAPSEGGVPPNSRTARTEMILPGVGIANDTAYTNPMWADPTRWNAALQPTPRLSDQLKTMRVFHAFYVENLAPLLFLIFLIAVAPAGTRRAIWSHGWVVYVPAIGGLVAYAMVIVTSRYVMPFVLAGTLVVLATTPVARRLIPRDAFIGFALPVALESVFPRTLQSLWFVTSAIGGVLAASITAARALVWVPVALVGMGLTLVLLPPSVPAVIRAGAAGIVVLFWRASLVAVRGGRTVSFARRTMQALALVVTVLFGYRLVARFDQDNAARIYAAKPTSGNVQWKIAQELASRGLTPGTRIAVVGSHYEAYWARTARLHIVASVPSNRVAAFWALPAVEQEKLLGEFEIGGATAAIATLRVVGAPVDSAWQPVKYRARLRFLTPPT
jgi:hypothetical protein